MFKTYIAKTKAGHYCVTICPANSKWPVFKRNGLASLEGARDVAKAFIDSQNQKGA